MQTLATSAELAWEQGQPAVVLFAQFHTNFQNDIGMACRFLGKHPGLYCIMIGMQSIEKSVLITQWHRQLQIHGFEHVDAERLWDFLDIVDSCIRSTPPESLADIVRHVPKRSVSTTEKRAA